MIDETKYTKQKMPDGKIVFTPIPEKKVMLEILKAEGWK